MATLLHNGIPEGIEGSDIVEEADTTSGRINGTSSKNEVMAQEILEV